MGVNQFDVLKMALGGNYPLPTLTENEAKSIQKALAEHPQNNELITNQFEVFAYFHGYLPLPSSQTRTQVFELTKSSELQKINYFKHLLGKMYCLGYGTSIDYGTAKQLFESAIKLGCKRSISSLGAMYVAGYFGKKDYLAAYDVGIGPDDLIARAISSDEAVVEFFLLLFRAGYSMRYRDIHETYFSKNSRILGFNNSCHFVIFLRYQFETKLNQWVEDILESNDLRHAEETLRLIARLEYDGNVYDDTDLDLKFSSYKKFQLLLALCNDPKYCTAELEKQLFSLVDDELHYSTELTDIDLISLGHLCLRDLKEGASAQARQDSTKLACHYFLRAYLKNPKGNAYKLLISENKTSNTKNLDLINPENNNDSEAELIKFAFELKESCVKWFNDTQFRSLVNLHKEAVINLFNADPNVLNKFSKLADNSFTFDFFFKSYDKLRPEVRVYFLENNRDNFIHYLSQVNDVAVVMQIMDKLDDRYIQSVKETISNLLLPSRFENYEYLEKGCFYLWNQSLNAFQCPQSLGWALDAALCIPLLLVGAIPGIIGAFIKIIHIIDYSIYSAGSEVVKIKELQNNLTNLGFFSSSSENKSQDCATANVKHMILLRSQANN